MPRPRSQHRRQLYLAACLSLAWSGYAFAQSNCDPPDELKQALAADPSAGAYNALGGVFAQQNRMDCAIPAFLKSIALDAEYWEPRFNLGLALAKGQEPRKAAEQLEAAVRLKPASFQAKLAWGFVLLELSDPAAEKPIQDALALQPESPQALFGMARVRMHQRRYSSAVTYLNKVSEASPNNIDIELMLGAAYAQDGKLEDAIRVLAKLVENNPTAAPAHFNLATAYAQAENFPAAAEHYQKVLELDPSNNAARMSAAKALANFSKHEELLELVARFSAKRPASVDEFELHHLRGVALRGLGRYGEAETDFARAAELRPNHSDTRYNLGFVLSRQKKYEQAKIHLEKAKELDPASADIRFQLGRVLQGLQEADRAKAELQQFQQKKEQDLAVSRAETAASKGNAALNEGDAAQALENYQEAIAANPTDARLYYDLSLAHNALGNKGDQQQALAKAIELDPSLEKAHNDLGILYLNIAWYDKAEPSLTKAIELNPQYAEAYNNLGVLYGRQGRNDESEKHFRRAIEDDPAYSQAYLNLGLMLAGQEKYKEAEVEVRKAVELSPESVRPLTALGMVLTKMGRTEDSLATLRKVIELDPNSAEARLNLGIALADGHNVDEALEVFTEAVRMAPESAAARFNRGRMLFQLDRHTEAKTELTKAVSLDPDHAHATYFLGLTHKELENHREAAEGLRRYITLAPADANGHYELGQAELKLGNREAAIANWEKAAEVDPNHKEALYNLFRELRNDNPDEARRYQERFQAAQSGQRVSDRADTLGNFALASLKAGNVPEAIRQLQEAIDICHGCQQEFLLHKNLGLIYARSGDLDKAEPELKLAAKIQPNDREVIKSLATIADLKNRSASTK